MPDVKQNSSFRIFHSIDEISKSVWDTITHDHEIFLSHDYLKCLENSKLSGLDFRYVLLYDDSTPVALSYFQTVNLSNQGLGGILSLEEYGGIASTISSKINDLLFSPSNGRNSYILVCGNLLVSGEYAVRSIDEKNYKNMIEQIPLIMREIETGLGTENKVVAFMIKDFYESSDKIVAPIVKKFFFPLNTDPEMILDIRAEWNSFDDYLAALSSKYRVRANSVIKKLDSIEIKELNLEQIIQSKNELFDLNDEVMRKAPVKLVRPNVDYCVRLKEHFGDHYTIKGFYLNNKLIAFISGIWSPHHYEAHHIGMRYELNKEYALYQNILYLYIQEAIHRKSKTLYFGRTALEIKSTVGAKPHDLACYFKFANRILNSLAKPLVGSTGPGKWIPRDPFRVENN